VDHLQYIVVTQKIFLEKATGWLHSKCSYTSTQGFAEHARFNASLQNRKGSTSFKERNTMSLLPTIFN
jgi:hypothetical protein